MKFSKLILLSAASVVAASPAALAQEEPTAEEIINNQLEYMCRYIEFDDVQLYYIDSTLQNDIPALMDELEALRKGGTANTEAYQIISDKWMEQIDNTYKKFFTKEQWDKYLRTAYGREMKARAKRMAKRQQK